jgi:hypothetical protein
MENLSTAALVNKRFKQAHQARLRYEREWKLDIAFYSGRQWVVYDPTSRRVVEWVPPGKKPRLVANLIMPVVRMEYARLTRNQPVFTVVAASGDQDDVAKAKACRKFLEWLWHSQNWEKTFREALLWALVCGNAFVKVFWDPMAGPVVDAGDGPRALGDVAIDYLTPFEVFVDPFARTMEEAAWVIHARVRSVEYVEEKYGVRVAADASTVVSALEGSVRDRILYGAEGNLPAVMVKEYWERPSSRHPRGRYAVVAANKVLYEGDNPYAATCPIPFVMMKHLPAPDQFYGASVVSHLRAINVIYNKLRSDIIENTTKLSNPMLLAPVNALLREPSWEAGEVIPYNPIVGGNFTPIRVDPYPSHMVNTLLRILQERDDISGVSEVSRGTVPRNVRSAAALAYLLEQDATRMNVVAYNWECFIGRALQYALNLARQFYEVPRVLRVLGENAEWEAKLFKAEDIPPEADVRVVAGSTLPKSQVQQQEFLLNLWDRRIVTDPRVVLRLTQYGSEEELYSDLELDAAQAARENQRMLDGEEVVVEDFHNHAVHIVEHNRLRKTVQYEELPEERKQIFRQHVAAHTAFLQQTIVQQAQQPRAGAR